MVSLRAVGFPSPVIEPQDSPMGLLAPKTPSEPQSNSPPGLEFGSLFLGPPAPHYMALPRLVRPALFRSGFKRWQQFSSVAPREEQSFADFLLPKHPSMVHKPPPDRAVLKIASLYDFSV